MTKFIKLYDDIVNDKNLKFDEAALLCRYINEYILKKGNVSSSDGFEAEYFGVLRPTIFRRRHRLEELGYIKCIQQNGEKTIIKISNDILEKLEITIYK